MSSKTPRETIQISLGSSANAITAHLLNLQGLTATSFDDDNGESYCDPLVTHTISQQQQQQQQVFWVPRVLMVDEGVHRVPPESPPVDTKNIIRTDHFSNMFATHKVDTTSFGAAVGGNTGSIPWTGTITSLSEDLSQFGIGTTGGSGNGSGGGSGTTSSYDNSFWKAASTLAYSPYSRYHVRGHDAPNATAAASHRSTTAVRADPDQPRHVIWDDDNEEEEEEEQEDAEQEDREEMSRRKRRAWNQWNTETAVPFRRQLTESAWSARRPSQEDAQHQQQRIGWRDIWMPPRLETSILTLPYSQQSQLVAHWEESYNGDNEPSNGTRRAWTEDVLLESLRHLLEACDGCQGVSITTQGQGIYAGLSNVLLEEFQEECKSAGRIVYHVTNPMDSQKPSLRNVKEKDTSGQSSPSWQEANVRRVRTQIGAGLALHDFAEKAHLVLPLRLDDEDARVGGLFRSSARMAVALEAASLPMRFRGGSTRNTSRQPKHSVGLQNAPFFGLGGDDVRWGTTARKLTVSEYVGMLRPSSSHPILELDALVASDAVTNNELRAALLQGTGIERDERMRQSGEDGFRRRPQETLPGAWLQDTSIPSGLLSSLSCSPRTAKTVADRSVHHHFALSSAVRPLLLQNDESLGTSTALSDYLSCLIEGMGVRYRPERSMATVIDQTVGLLTLGGDGAGYGAGAYWRHLLPSSIDSPAVAVLGNTTRSYASLHATATDMKSAMGTRYRGYVNRDVMNGVLPEQENVEEALARAWDLCDAYYPPNGSGFEID